ncbi:RagB/SusD family nutrient uptake outer membrane protein [Flavivirga aquimarina]|uniref:RagB/SusD family nutrient uptake outer membrane protein n=1 Tax=Flavivirga aquimarina TaxID=2027862 RepID=A0ABT8WH90_9FLAO|nr:RagB/SusD family nutrient uptake outer membrane protein [Flavivirga aquimarina]MDO5972357.1 RagB/SusD family nutrient uptake outer membrane protein [Flavivirga aquimarina]
MKLRILTIYNLLIFALLSISIASCDDILEEDPKTFISPDNFFNTVDDYEAAIKGVYGITHNLFGGRQTELKELFADFYDQPESAEQGTDMWRNNPGNNFWAIRQGWSVPYQVISNANQILASLEGNTTISVANKNSIEAETKFLRAYAYFQLVQLYGDAPLRTTPVGSVNDVQIDRTSQSEIYDLILQDLIDAESGLPNTSEQEGRVNTYVAKALLARVYLTTAGNPMGITQNYQLALNKANEVINGPYSLLDNFADVFKNTSYTSESIWEILYLDGVTSNGKHNQTAPTGNQTALLLPTTDFINSFPNGDSRSSWGIQDGFTTSGGSVFISRTYFNKFIDESKLEQELPPAATQTDYSFPIIRLAEMYLIAAEAENEINGPDNAYPYINEIRSRARNDENDLTHVPDLSGLTQEEFRTAVLNERKWELYTEEHAWFDLKRTNTFNSVQDARGVELNVPIGSYNTTWILPDFEILNNNIPDNPPYGG